MSRRKYIKYLGAAATVAGVAALGAYDHSGYLGKQTVIASATGTPTTATLASTSTSLQQTSLQSTYLGESVEKYIHELWGGYPTLAEELEKLPDVRDNEADPESIQQIARLALNATNPEVHEAFDLMIRLSGLPPDSDYDPPPTALQLLYEMGRTNKFQEDDTVVLAIAIANGLWSTMGSSDSLEAVYSDANDLLAFGRETATIQKNLGLPYSLKDYPLEAKLCWAWTGNVSQAFGPHQIVTSSFNLRDYEWNTVGTSTLRKMREMISTRDWWSQSAYRTAANIEDHFQGAHWEYSKGGEILLIDGEPTPSWHIGNVDFEFKRYLDQGNIIGDCVDQSAMVEAFLKAAGISATFVQKWRFDSNEAHMHTIFYDPEYKTYRGYANQLNTVGLSNGFPPSYSIYFPPIRRREYLQQVYLRSFASNGLVWFYRGFSVPKGMTDLQLYQQMLGTGFRSSLVKEMDVQWYD